ncbi:PHP domain-containing protein [Natronobiforma cellulositropha]|uniref:PHP domain-containing protein n=1 Tax=Natronobiforma cellulositropha TaxID=1679076 RepID=UPI0021D5D5FC|nr:PHP domain-containing protein [Natronobiforma cellulositropha]
MPYADLHVHTTRSDGTLDLEAVPAAAHEAGVRVVAITDHDRLQPFSEPTVERDGVTLVSGIELRVEAADGTRVDLLGHGVSPTAGLERCCGRIQRNRRERGRAIADRVEDRLGIDLDLAIEDGVGRPHVARAVAAHPETALDYQDAFDDLIGDGCPCYVPREIPSFERGVALLKGACTLVSLAHPLRYRDPAAALALTADLDALEYHYPYGRTVETAPLERAIDRHGLQITGGSDAHGTRLGRAGLTRAEFQRLGLLE